MSFAVGVGSTPDASFVVGGIFRSTTYFNLGTDLSIGPRFASGGFARGDWGAALDVGVTGRYWRGGDYGSTRSTRRSGAARPGASSSASARISSA